MLQPVGWPFCTELMKALSDAVREEDPDAITMTNFVVGYHVNVHITNGIPHWTIAIKDWRRFVDIVTCDYYPNYYSSDIDNIQKIGCLVKQIKKLVYPDQQLNIRGLAANTPPLCSLMKTITRRKHISKLRMHYCRGRLISWQYR